MAMYNSHAEERSRFAAALLLQHLQGLLICKGAESAVCFTGDWAEGGRFAAALRTRMAR